jgi:hypothetical protein
MEFSIKEKHKEREEEERWILILRQKELL